MLPTFVIGLREGLEAALIVGIIAAFLRRQGRGDLIRQLGLGVGAAVAICAAVGLGLEFWSRSLPQRQQEGLETVIAVLAVAMVTYMVLWMKGHSRGLKGELESLAAGAIEGSGRAGTAMVAMAFLAVLREGFETAVFLLAAFNESGSGAGAALGALLGIAVAVALGYGIYRGGVRLNLSRFFRATGIVLVLVAGGLVATALHTAHEAGWLDVGQHRLLDLSWLVQPGSVLSSVLTGMLGLQPMPVLAEVLGWLAYVVPLTLFVAWPPGRPVPWRRLHAALAGLAVLGLAGGAALAATAPAAPAQRPALQDAAVTARVVASDEDTLTLHTGGRTLRLAHVGGRTADGLTLETYRTTLRRAGDGPGALPVVRVAALNGGRLPLGVTASTTSLPARYVDTRTLDVAVAPATERVVVLRWTTTRAVVVTGADGHDVALAEPVARHATAPSASAAATALAAARADRSAAAMRADRLAWSRLCVALGLVSGIVLASAAAVRLAVPVVQRRPI